MVNPWHLVATNDICRNKSVKYDWRRQPEIRWLALYSNSSCLRKITGSVWANVGIDDYTSIIQIVLSEACITNNVIVAFIEVAHYGRILYILSPILLGINVI